MSKKLSKEERLWNFLTAKVGSVPAKRIYHYVMKNFGNKPKEIHIRYKVDTSEISKALKLATKLDRLRRK